MGISPQRIRLSADELEHLEQRLFHWHDDVDLEWVSEIADSMRNSGFDTRRPIVVIANPDGSMMTLADGRHRRAAALEAGLESVPALLVTFDEMDELEEEHYNDSEVWYPALLKMETP
jgi:ParB-like chromosome segregation protein Spo0J